MGVFVMYFVGFTAARKLKRMNIYLSRGLEGNERLINLRDVFNHYVDKKTNGDNFLVGSDIKEVALTAGRTLSSSECTTIMRFFNPNLEGTISYIQWMEGFELV